MNGSMSRRVVLAIACATGVIMAVVPGQLEARGRRMRAMVAVPAAPCPPGPRADDRICPQYIWMNHGSYYSFYALSCTSGTPKNYDSSLPTTYSGCTTECPFLIRPNLPGHIENAGYGNSMTDVAEPLGVNEIPGGDTARLRITPKVTIGVKFKAVDGSDLFAEVFQAELAPLSGATILTATRGLQVSRDPAASGVRVYDLSSGSSSGMSIHGAAGTPHTYLLECADTSPLGKRCTINIVTHRSAPGHAVPE